MAHRSRLFRTLPLSVLLGLCAGSVSAAEVDEAIALLKQTHDDQCEQQKLRGRLLIAHQSHDTTTLEALTPKLEALNARMKPSTEKLKELSAKFQDDSQARNAFEKAQIEMGTCD